MGNNILTLRNVSKYYVSAQSVVVGLNGISLSFEPGEFVAVTGASGSGKSTLAHVLGGIIPYENGELFFAGRPTSHYDGNDWEHYRREQISFVSQNYGILSGNTVYSNIFCALRLSGMRKGEARRRAKIILREVDLEDCRNRRAAKLSSGQKQRLSIARAIAKPTPILIADEPTGNLDAENSVRVLKLLADCAKERLVVLITHEFGEAAPFVTRHIVLQDGRVAMDASVSPEGEVPLETEFDDDTVTEDDGDVSAPAVEKAHRTLLVDSDEMPRIASFTDDSEGKTVEEDDVGGKTRRRVVRTDEAPKSVKVKDGRNRFNAPGRRRSTRGLGPFVARVQTRARPMWALLLVLFFALTAFAVFAFLGTFVVAADDTSTRIYDNTAFRNGDPTRVVVTRTDGARFEERDFTSILSLRDVRQIERYGFVSDVAYAYRPDVDYRLVYSDTRSGGAIQFIGDERFVRTIPALPEDAEFLTDGALPSSMYEVVATAGTASVGDALTVFVRDDRHWEAGEYLCLEVVVSGVTDFEGGLYFHRDLGLVLNSAIGTDASDPFFYPESPRAGTPLEHDTFRAAADIYDVWRLTEINKTFTDDTLPVSYPTRNDSASGKMLHLALAGKTASTVTRAVEVSAADFDALVSDRYADQISLFITDYAYTDSVLRALSSLGYSALSPFRECSTTVDVTKATERVQTLILCVLALVVVVALQIGVLRAMFGMEFEYYQLLANIGLICPTAKASILWQVVGFALIGQIVCGSAVYVCARLEITRITDILKYLPAPYLVLLACVHMLTSIVAAIWTMKSLAKRVFPLAAVRSDLNFDILDEEAMAE